MRIELATYPMSFRFEIRHASAARRVTENIICRVTSAEDVIGVGEGCPRSYVTGETSSSARDFLRSHSREAACAVETHGYAGLVGWTERNRSLIDKNPAATAALEIAMIDMLARTQRVPIELIVGQPRLRGLFNYTAVVSDSGPLAHDLMLRGYLLCGFRDFKLKLSGDIDRDRKKVRRLRKRRGVRIRFDANNLWTEPGPCIDHLRRLEIELFAIEEPLQAGELDGFAEVATALGTQVVLDESCLRADQLADVPGDPSMWILNCRISKMGGIGRSLEAVDGAQGAGFGVIVGAQIGETSVLSRAGLTVAAAAGPGLIAQEGAFGTRLLRRDLTEPIIMFDRGGRIRTGKQVDPDAPGLGLRTRNGALTDIEQVA